MATAASFALGGAGMLLLHQGGRRAVVAGQSCALAVAVLASASLFGYLFGAQVPAKLAAFSSMALHTTFGFLVAAAAMLWLRPSDGLMRDLTGRGLGSMLLRWLLLGALLLPPLIGFFRLMGERAGWYGTEFALALHVTLQGVVLAAGVWVVSRWLTRADDARAPGRARQSAAHRRLREAGATLEGRVALRTRELSESEAKFRSLLELAHRLVLGTGREPALQLRLGRLRAADRIEGIRLAREDTLRSAERVRVRRAACAGTRQTWRRAARIAICAFGAAHPRVNCGSSR